MPNSSFRHKLSRRRFLKLSAGALLAAAGTATYTRTVEPRWVEIAQVDLPVPRLAPALDGTRFVQISDLHLGKYFSSDRLNDAVAHIHALNPQWVVMTGDYVGHYAGAAQGLVDPLRQLDLPLYATLGNHDYWTDRGQVERHLRSARATVLVNQARPLADNLWLAGIDDLWGGRPDLRAALREVPTGATTLLLAHEPDFFDQVLRRDAPVTVQFSGHSHGGQIRLPQAEPGPSGLYSWAPVLPRYAQRYPIGLRTVGTRTVYTNRGLGVWPLPFRLNCRPEITVFTLVAA